MSRRFSHSCLQYLGVVHVGRTVQGDDTIAPRLQAKVQVTLLVFDLSPQHLKGIDHDVAHPLDLLRCNSFPEQVLVGIPRRRPEDIGQNVGDQPVELFGHRPVEGPQAGLQVGDTGRRVWDWVLGTGYWELVLGIGNRVDDFRRGDGCGHGGVHVADDHDEVGPLFHEKLFVGDHDLAGLLGVRAVPHIEVDVGRGQAEVHEEGVGHVEVVVLAGVDDDGPGPVALSSARDTAALSS